MNLSLDCVPPRWMQYTLRFLRSEQGPTAVEYAVLLALILLVAISAIGALGGGVEGKWKQNADQIVNSMRSAGR